MLSPEENERLSRVEGKAIAGQLVRRYWLPALQSSDLPAPDCDPVRVKLLGEDLVAFRDTSGRPGLINPHCPHRMADLYFGRNEEDGIRCIYHGWKFAVTGQCLETPTEPPESDFARKIQLLAYPVEERAGVIFAYMGPPELKPPLPDFEWMHAPDTHRFVSWSTQDCNYAQAIEGGIDTMHSIYLHSTLDSHRRLDQWKGGLGERLVGVQARFRTKDNPAKLYAENTDYGVLVGGRYAGKEGEDYWRYNLFLMPFYTMPPGGPGSKLCHAFVPLDDVTTARWSFTWKLETPYTARELAALRLGSGVHSELVPGTHFPRRTRANSYLIDREEQRTLTFTGIKGTGEQDFAVQEGMGPICDRSQEHLGVSDVGIIQMRRRILQEVTNLEMGVEPYSASHGDVFRIHAGDTLLPSDVVDWMDDQATRKALAVVW
ncbi:MAG: phthalate 4,5-dioxygenase [Chloroflexota bacterium]|nr:phthalate 4,5-dioxygenase [Chloroflexota bacterium]